jgi:glycosyltransferase involved in cell wall biosynthesis
MDKGIDERRLAHIGVWSDSQEVTPLPRATNPYRTEWGLDDAFVVMYAGNFGLGHDVVTMCEAAYKLRDRTDIRFVFVGGGKRKAEVDDYVRRHNLDTAVIRDYEPREKLDALLSLGDLHLASLSAPVLGIMVPCKLFGIMAAERPAVFIGPGESELARVLVENDCGFVVPCGDSDQLVAIIEKCAADAANCRAMGARARAALSRVYNRQSACEAWLRLLGECARPKPTSGPTPCSDHRESMGE